MSVKYYLFLLVVLTACYSCTTGGGEPPGAPAKAAEALAAAPAQYNYAVFFENSGSLNGYLQASGDEDFRSNVGDIIATIGSFPSKKSLSIYHINTQTDTVLLHADATQLSSYLEQMTPATFKASSARVGGKRSQSDLSDVIKKVVAQTGPGDVSLLVTDGIFSPGKNADARHYLNTQESSIKMFFGEQLRKAPFATLVLQCYSGFPGTYYEQDNKERKGPLLQRPYYMLCFGSEPALHRLLQYAARPGNKGFQAYLFLTTAKQYKVAPQVRYHQDCYEYDPESPMVVTDVHKEEKSGRFRVKCALNYTTLPVDNAYLEDPANYEVTPGYTVASVKPLKNNKSTHELILDAAAPQRGTVRVALKRQLPQWIGQSNIDTDKGIANKELEGKTFGIRYLLGGLYNAYATYIDTPEYFNFFITVKD